MLEAIASETVNQRGRGPARNALRKGCEPPVPEKKREKLHQGPDLTSSKEFDRKEDHGQSGRGRKGARRGGGGGGGENLSCRPEKETKK